MINHFVCRYCFVWSNILKHLPRNRFDIKIRNCILCEETPEFSCCIQVFFIISEFLDRIYIIIKLQANWPDSVTVSTLSCFAEKLQRKVRMIFEYLPLMSGRSIYMALRAQKKLMHAMICAKECWPQRLRE